jgi:hypothetical protein
VSETVIDLSQVRFQKTETKNATYADVKETMMVFKETMLEAVDVRFALMQELPKAAAARVEVLDKNEHPAVIIKNRLMFLDRTLNRLTDLVTAAAIVVEHENDPSFLNKFPSMVARLQDVMNVIVANRDKKLEETTNDEALLIAGYRDAQRHYLTIQMAK